jgi:hypothetical protein
LDLRVLRPSERAVLGPAGCPRALPGYAVGLQAELGTWITPVICLHTRNAGAFRSEGVSIVPQPALLEWIRAKRNTVANAECFATSAADP